MNKSTDLNRYRRSLLAKQRELLTANGGRLVLAPAGGIGADEMDQALAESQATVEVHVTQTRSRLRQAIEWALVRLKKGNYGSCVACGNTISRARLKAVPWTDRCRDCAEQEGTRF